MMTTVPVVEPPGLCYRLVAPNLVGTPKLVRDHVATVLRHSGCEDIAETARLLVSETATNVFLHAAVARLTVATTIGPERVLIEVEDESAREQPERRVAGEWDAESGRGLALLDALAEAWGVRPVAQAKVVWFELRLPQGTAR
ncbi:ATP-binding protein [Streptomyces sp. 6N223]|uniref:ATP-binding protein n=1 Tax=Streptomyces sp. 6N223 TaxID=3457412 RepID=UPI003FD698EA